MALASGAALQVIAATSRALPLTSARRSWRVVGSVAVRSNSSSVRAIQIDWHPASESHLCLLTDGDRQEFRVYNVAEEGEIGLEASWRFPESRHGVVSFHFGTSEPLLGRGYF